MTADATQGQELEKRWKGIIASSDPIVVVDKLQDRFKEDPSVQIFYHTDEGEYGRLRDALLMMGVQKFTLLQRGTGVELQAFLQEFLANLLGGVPYGQLSDRTTIDQLSRDIELLIRA